MSAVPNWLGATAGQPPLATQVNQLLGPHSVAYLYAAVLAASVTTMGAATTGTNGLYLAQSFTTGVSQTAVGYVAAPISTTATSGSALQPTTLGLYANSAGAPSGSALVSTTVTAEYANLSTGGSSNVFTVFPLPATGLSPSTTYWLVLAAAGTSSSNQYTWFRSASASGVSTSTNGSTWTAQAYGFRYSVYDQTSSGLLTASWEDSGARWTANTYNANGAESSYAEYTVAQGSNQYVQSFRSLSYTGGILTGVA